MERMRAQNEDIRNSYPNFEISDVLDYLQSPRPVWYLDLNGVLRASNLLAFWLWGAISPTDETIQVRQLLGANLFHVYSRPDNFLRIEKPKSIDDDSADFIQKKLSVARNLIATNETADKDSIHAYLSFINAVGQAAAEGDPVLREIYEQTEPNQSLEWTYSLKIRSPDEPHEILEFTGTVARVSQANVPIGFIAIYRPLNKQTAYRIRQEYERLRERYGEQAYVQYQDEQVKYLLIEGIQQPTEDSTTTISLYILEDPLTARNMATIVSALTELHTKLWLLQEGRTLDFTLYTKLGLHRFEDEAPLIINRLTYNSPAWMELLSTALTAGGMAVMVKLIDAVIQAPLRYREKKQDIEQQRIDFIIEEIKKSLELVEKYADPVTKEETIKSLLATLVGLENAKGLGSPLLIVNRGSIKHTEENTESED